MATGNPPTYFFNGITYNDLFFVNTSNSINQSYADAHYLARIGTASSTATTTTFSGSVGIGATVLSQTANNFNFVNGANNALTLTNAPNTSFLSGYSTQSYLNSISSGIMYLAGLSGTATGAYNLQTDSLGHLSFATGTNTLNIGISGTANGNINLYGQGVLTIPATTGTAISVPNGNINSNTISTTTTATIGTSLLVNSFATIGGNILMNGAISSVLYTDNATNQLRIQGGPATSTYGVIISTNAGGSGDALSVIPTGATTALITLAQPTNITSTLNVGNQINMTGTSGNRTINNVFYNFNDATTFSNDGRIYANGTNIFYEGLVNNGNHTFTTRDNGGVAATQLQIMSTGVTITPPLTASSVYIGTNTDTTGQAEIRLYPSIWMDTVTANTWRFYNNNGIGQYIFYNNNVANMAISGTAITNFVNLTLPTTYSAIPTINQLGGNSQITFTASQAISTGVFKNLGSITTPAGGTYIINLAISIVCTVAGTLSRHVIEASTSNSVFNNNMSQQQQYESVALIATNGQVWTTSYTIQATTATTIYGNVLLAFTGTMTGTGLISYTRIA